MHIISDAIHPSQLVGFNGKSDNHLNLLSGNILERQSPVLVTIYRSKLESALLNLKK